MHHAAVRPHSLSRASRNRAPVLLFPTLMEAQRYDTDTAAEKVSFENTGESLSAA